LTNIKLETKNVSFKHNLRETSKEIQGFLDALILTLFPKFSSTKPQSTNILNNLKFFITGRHTKNNVISIELFQKELHISRRRKFNSFYDKDAIIILVIEYNKKWNQITTHYVVTVDAIGREKFVLVTRELKQ
jgi:ATP-dependent exoDNAse (exonuclease V) alpha subunit